jgi:hypothetical protein
MQEKYYIEAGVKLTPKKAAEWLETVTRNRDISEKVVEHYVKLMQDGKWLGQNGSTMIFDWNGEFRDGQHRAWAVLRSNITITVDVAYNADPDVIRTVDQGNRRSGADTLVMEERSLRGKGAKLKNAQSIASALPIVAACFLKGDIYHKVKMSNDEIHQWYLDHMEIAESAEKVCKRGNLASSSVCTAIHFVLSRVHSHKQLVDEFFERFIVGDNLASRSPVLALRNKFLTTRNDSRASCSRTFTISCILRAWDAFAAGKELKTIVFTPDSLPQPTKKLRRVVLNQAA